MVNTLLGTKQTMSSIFVEDTMLPVTWVKVGPCVVTQIKTPEKDGYWAVQFGFGEKKIKNVTKPLLGHLKKATKNEELKDLKTAKKTMPRFLREVRLKSKPEFKVGDVIGVSDIFGKGDVVQVTGISKGKGFAGVVKRWGFAGGPKTHGQSDRQRAPGAIGQGTSPGRVHKGKKMAGRIGNKKVTVKNLIIADINKDESQIAISGHIPGVFGGLLVIKKTGSGKLEELVERAPEVQVVQIQEESEDKRGQELVTEKEKGRS